MTLLALTSVALGAGVAIVVLAGERRFVALAVGFLASVGVLGLALAMPAEESLVIGGVGLVSTPVVRAMAVAWSAGTAVLGLLELAVGGRPTVVGPSLIGLAVAGIALATRDPASSVAALAAGSVVGVVIPGLSGWLDSTSSTSRLITTGRGSLAVIGSGLLGLAVVAWGASGAGPLGGGALVALEPAGRFGLGMALLGMVTAVAIRCGLIPLHVWAARFMEGVSPLAIPAAFAWGSAAFVLVALDWSQVALGPTAAGDVERVIIVGLALVSVVLGGLAAMVHDDIEHVLGYSILADAGVAVVLAFASLEPEAVAAARNWLVASATVKTALAAWAAVVRSTYGGHRLEDLGGWARRSPVLGLALGGIIVGAVGLPGMSLFEARTGLVSAAMPGIGVVVALLVALMPAVYLGRIAMAGIGPVSLAVAGGPSGMFRWSGGRAMGWSESSRGQAVRAIPTELRANRAPLAALGVNVLTAMALVTAAGGAGG